MLDGANEGCLRALLAVFFYGLGFGLPMKFRSFTSLLTAERILSTGSKVKPSRDGMILNPCSDGATVNE